MARLNLINNNTSITSRPSPTTKKSPQKPPPLPIINPRSVKKKEKKTTGFKIFEDGDNEDDNQLNKAMGRLSLGGGNQQRKPSLPKKLAHLHVNSVMAGRNRPARIEDQEEEEEEEEDVSDKENHQFIDDEAEEEEEEEEENEVDRERDLQDDSTDGQEEDDGWMPSPLPTRKRQGPSRTALRNERSEDEYEEDDDETDSLDGFIVSDNEEPSYHEWSDPLPDDDDDEDFKAPSPPPPPTTTTKRRRLFRGRRPRASLVPDAQQDSQSVASTPRSDRLSKPSRRATPERQVNTPPLSPRRVGRIPPSPHKEEDDEFWSQSVTDAWNERWSPPKQRTPGRSVQRRLLQLNQNPFSDDSSSSDDEAAPNSFRISTPAPAAAATTSPVKPPSKTALKKAEAARKREARERKREFDNRKTDLAHEFLRALDDGVTDGAVHRMAASAGGVKITWSKTLRTTAGRARYRHERRRSANTGATTDLHHASIELAEKIIDSEERLYNTLAHEFCHLANFMVSRVTSPPHGESFKAWGRRCDGFVRDHPVYAPFDVHVTTTHRYQIDWKYVWACVDCGQTYGRQSNSIDPARVRCSVCMGVLQRIKPKPRATSASPRTKQVSAEEVERVGQQIERVELE